MQDVTPSSFQELTAELYSFSINTHGRYRSNFVYRGMDDASWGLETTLQRIGPHYCEVEKPLLRNYFKYSVDRDLPSQTLLYKLAVAQHHGLPTRVLDWSTSPRVALHFAVGDEKLFDSDGVVWAVDVVELHRLLPKSLENALNNERAFLFSVDMLREIEDLDGIEALAGNDTFALFFEPPSLDGRIVNQAAILSFMPKAVLDFRTFLESHPEAFRRIVIRSALKWEIRDKLDQDQINERMLFPGVDGTARWLKRYYGPGPVSEAQKTALAFTGPMTGVG